MTVTTPRGAGQTGARGIISGSISNGVTWYEDIEITEDGTVIASANTWVWYLTLREEYDTAPILTLSTTAGTLIISQGSSSTTLQIRVPRASLSDLEGDYICDIASVDSSSTTYDSAGRSQHWAHGIINVRNEPVLS